jgi:uncharacterized protein
MSVVELAGLLALAGFAAYVQTMTGFAFGLLLMAGVALAHLLSLPDAAVLVSTLALINALQMLSKGWRQVAWRAWAQIVVSSLPVLALSYLLLEWLADTRVAWLKLLLGLVTMASSLQLAGKPAPLAKPSGPGSMLFFGALAGVMGGLFSTGGPPLVYHLYRQPWPAAVVRETLVAVFALNATIRLSMVASTGNIPGPEFWPCLLAIPVVMLGTATARRYPVPLSPTVFRRVVFALLFLSGVSLALPAFLSLIGLVP